ncbi:hypothetical protein N2152v2_008350 [Parachlorella kessleri]
MCRPIYGLIFLFRWQKEADDRPIEADFEAKGVFFASQVINNACATQAIVSVLMNRPDLEIGNELRQLREFTAGFPPDMKGLAIGNSEAIRSVHNSFTPPQPIIPEKDDDDTKGEAFHFIAYVPVNGALYELDGLKPGPIKLADCSEEDWLEKAAAMVTERIGRYAAHEIKFNLMAVIRNRKQQLEEQVGQQQQHLSRIQAKLSKSSLQGMQEEGEALPDDPSTLTARLHEAQQQIERLNMEIAVEEEKYSRWREENLRRKTDYIPLAFNLLKLLAEKGQLQPLVDRAVAAQRDKKQ